MTEFDKRLLTIELFAWVGEDELGSGEIGLKQAIVAAGCIPMVATRLDKMDQPYIAGQMDGLALRYNTQIRLVRFVATEILKRPGDDFPYPERR